MSLRLLHRGAGRLSRALGGTKLLYRPTRVLSTRQCWYEGREVGGGCSWPAREAVWSGDGVSRWTRRGFQTSVVAEGVTPILVRMPALSPTMEEGSIVKWMVKEGEAVSEGDPLCEVETDKAEITMDCDQDAVLARILAPEGTRHIKLGSVIALLVEPGEDYTQVEMPSESEMVMSEGGSSEGVEVRGEEATVHTGSPTSLPLSPAVRYLVDTNHLDLSLIPATGPHSRLLKGDVLQYMEDVRSGGVGKTIPTRVPVEETDSARPAPERGGGEGEEGMYTDVPVSDVRRGVAHEAVKSKVNLPHCYVSVQCNVDKLLTLLHNLKGDRDKGLLDSVIIKAAAATLQRLPHSNAVWAGDQVQLLPTVDVSVAVATEMGSMSTLVVKDANRQSMESILNMLKQAQSESGVREDTTHDAATFTVATFTSSHLTSFTSVIHPQQSATLTTGGLQMGLTTDGTPSKFITATLSCDARVLDYELASQWLDEFKKSLEDPSGHGLL